jgi:uncharacterized protein YbaR (Trm112 family)
LHTFAHFSTHDAVPLVKAYNAAMIPQDLLDILVCPVCKKRLQLKETGESLKCTECRRVYPVRDNIPILLVDEAVTEPS